METNFPLTKNQESIIVIPAYQPSKQLISLVHTLTISGYSVIVVDDGSDSSYTSVFEKLEPCTTIIHHDQNYGKGAALKTAFRYIQTCIPNAGCIITMDADGQHLPEDMAHVALCAWTHPGTLVLGSRNFNKEIPLRSKLGNKITKFVFSCITKTPIQDTQTGLRAFDRSLLCYMLQIHGNRYEYEMNVLLHCKKSGIAIQEVPIQTIYLDKENSSSHFDGIRDSFRIYQNIFKFASASFVSFFIDYFLFLLFHAILPFSTFFLILSNVLARFGSAAFNYILNTKVVFHDSRPVSQTFPQYVKLACGILAANSLILTLLSDFLKFPPTIAKLTTEILLFLLSFFVQTCFIFKQPTKGDVFRHAKEQRAA